MRKIICEKKDCTHEAKFAPKLYVPAVGWPLDAHRPMTAVLGMKLCRDHFREFKQDQEQDLIGKNPSLATIFTTVTTGMGACAPDFKRAFFTPLSLDSSEYLAFRAMTDKSKKEPI